MAILPNLCQRELAQEPAGMQRCWADSPADDLLGFRPDEMFLFRGQNAQGELLTCPALPIHHVCALVHVDGALRQGCGLQRRRWGRGSCRDEHSWVRVWQHGLSPHPQALPALWQLCRSPVTTGAQGSALPRPHPHGPTFVLAIPERRGDRPALLRGHPAGHSLLAGEQDPS